MTINFVDFLSVVIQTLIVHSNWQVYGEHVRAGERALSGSLQIAGARQKVAARACAT